MISPTVKNEVKGNSWLISKMYHFCRKNIEFCSMKYYLWYDLSFKDYEVP